MILDDIADHLVTALGLTKGTDLFMNWRPEDPDEIIVISDYSQDAPIDTMKQAVPLAERPRIQLLARDEPMNVVECEARCRAAYEVLCAILGTTIGGSTYTFTPMQAPTMMGRDEQQRVLYVANFQTVRTS